MRVFIALVKRAFSGDKARQNAEAKKAYGMGIDALERAEKAWVQAMKTAQDKLPIMVVLDLRMKEKDFALYDMQNVYNSHETAIIC